MSVTADFGIPAFPPGFGMQQGDLLSLWSNAALFMTERIVFRATQTTTATSLPSNGDMETIIFDTVIEDPYSGYNPSTGHWTAPGSVGSGWYHVTTTVWLANPGTTGVVLNTYIGDPAGGVLGTGIPVGAVTIPSSAAGCGGSCYQWMSANQDYVYVQANLGNLGSGSVNTNLTNGQNSHIEIIWIGA